MFYNIFFGTTSAPNRLHPFPEAIYTFLHLFFFNKSHLPSIFFPTFAIRFCFGWNWYS